MCEEEEPSNSIEVSIIDSIAKAELVGLGADVTEVTLDALLDDDLLQSIPIVATVGRIYRVVVTIRDRLFLRKVLSFLKELADVPADDRRQFAEQLDKDVGTRSKAGAALALLLERLDDLEKPQIVGRLYKARLEGRLSFDELRRFCMVVERAHLPDLIGLAKLPPGQGVDELAAPYLYALGLVSITGEDYGTFDGIGAATYYEINDVGKKFLASAFPD